MRKSETFDRTDLVASVVERDLGVMVDSELKFSKHVECQVKKANRILGLIKRSFVYLDGNISKQMFVALVCPHLEFVNVAWSP